MAPVAHGRSSAPYCQGARCSNATYVLGCHVSRPPGTTGPSSVRKRCSSVSCFTKKIFGHPVPSTLKVGSPEVNGTIPDLAASTHPTADCSLASVVAAVVRVVLWASRSAGLRRWDSCSYLPRGQVPYDRVGDVAASGRADAVWDMNPGAATGHSTATLRRNGIAYRLRYRPNARLGSPAVLVAQR